jgi:hypothetical protein
MEVKEHGLYFFLPNNGNKYIISIIDAKPGANYCKATVVEVLSSPGKFHMEVGCITSPLKIENT